MPISFAKEDIRSVKTERALEYAMLSLLKARNFRKITVKDICDEALISRATFYAHFTDKYDFLKEWLFGMKPENIRIDMPFMQMEESINQFVQENEAVIKNLVNSADDETLGILQNFFTVNLKNGSEEDKTNQRVVVFDSFYAGGMVNYLAWHVRNNFPQDIKPMNVYVYEIIEMFQAYKRDKF